MLKVWIPIDWKMVDLEKAIGEILERYAEFLHDYGFDGECQGEAKHRAVAEIVEIVKGERK